MNHGERVASEVTPLPALPRRHISQDVTLTMLGFGGAPIGGMYAGVSRQDAAGALRAAYQAGVRHFDTAPLYGSGLSERRIGEFLASVPRDDVVVSSKVGRLLTTGEASTVEFPDSKRALVFDYSARGVRRSLSESLERLGLERLDVVFIHDPDDHWEQAINEAYPALVELKDEGLVGAIGVGMNQSAMLTRFVRSAAVDCVMVAGRYTLLDRQAADDILPTCLERGVAVIAAGVFNSGLLADHSECMFDYRPATPDLIAETRRLQALCATYDVPLAAAAIQFPLTHPAIRSVCVGARTAREINDDVRLFHSHIPQELMNQLRAWKPSKP